MEVKDRDIVEPPNRLTMAGAEYLQAFERNLRLFGLIADTFTTGDFVAHKLRGILYGPATDPKLDSSELARTNPGPRTLALRKFDQEIVEMFLSRSVDNFQTYIVDLIRAVLQQKPTMLSATQPTLSLEYVLQFETIDALAQDVIEAKVSSLSYRGFVELEEWCEKKGIPLVVPEGEREAVIDLIATRNLITHNRGKIDERYLRNVRSDHRIGDKRILGDPDFSNSLSLLSEIVWCTDSAVGAKFRLPTTSSPPPRADNEVDAEEKPESI